jgi:hypothetical protein
LESRDIGFQHRWRITLRIDADQHRLHPGGQSRLVLLELCKTLHDPLQVDRAYVRAIGIAEIDDPVLAFEVVPFGRLTILIGQGEGRADPRTGQFTLFAVAA